MTAPRGRDTADRLAYRIRESAEKLGISESKMRSLVKSGDVRSVTLDGVVLVPVIEIERILGIESGPRPTARHVAEELLALIEGRAS